MLRRTQLSSKKRWRRVLFSGLDLLIVREAQQEGIGHPF
jgi:hypothetical protein